MSCLLHHESFVILAKPTTHKKYETIWSSSVLRVFDVEDTQFSHDTLEHTFTCLYHVETLDLIRLFKSVFVFSHVTTILHGSVAKLTVRAAVHYFKLFTDETRTDL